MRFHFHKFEWRTGLNYVLDVVKVRQCSKCGYIDWSRTKPIERKR